ncbi:hypothetical protein HUF15_25715 [Streptomyces samsunensis]|uniref:hypothetical protein n=1 Tax=Streptomyces malaysiensis TaxID=92644 RepID=UPI0015815CEB|nr:hypothetical protein [Streptomyces samsunensis]NUH40117.1 hypothetical protein [Streptomyces samsunensis]
MPGVLARLPVGLTAEAAPWQPGRQVFQDEESGGCISGDDVGSKAGPEVVAEELKRGQLGTQPPRGSTGVP